MAESKERNVSLGFSFDEETGKRIHGLIERLYPICRSITGNGVRETLSILGERISLQIHEVPTGTKVFDWEVPKEWNIKDAYITDPEGKRLVDFNDSNLHVVSYSVPVDKEVSLEELKSHLYSLPEFPDRIPYRTNYYNESWGFCVRDSLLGELKEEKYRVCINSSLKDGHLSYGELYLPGASDAEVLFSSHICHPSLCNDNLSSVAVLTEIADILSRRERRFSYRFLFVPGTIGAITWLARNSENVKSVFAGLVLAGVGDMGKVHYKRSRRGDAGIDRVVASVLRDSGDAYEILPFSPYGYDERQYCSPGFNLPMGCFMRTPFGTYPEYHTSADNLDFVKPDALENSLRKLLSVVERIENGEYYVNTNPYCEPQLGRRGLYPGGSAQDEKDLRMAMLWVLNLSDGEHSLLDISERSGIAFRIIREAAELLKQGDLLKEKLLAK